jgi:hypothetical protein
MNYNINITNSTYVREEITVTQLFYIFMLVIGVNIPICICALCCRFFDKLEQTRVNNYRKLYHDSKLEESTVNVSNNISTLSISELDSELDSEIEAPTNTDRP